jgi:serine/threonine-protein kinase
MSSPPSNSPSQQPHNNSALLNNRYRLLSTVAAGGMATVYKAQDTMLSRLVAVKILRDRIARDPQFVQRFREEAQAAANLNHPNIVTIYDVGSDMLNGQERHYIVMELVEGEDLKQLLRALQLQTEPIDVDDAIQIARQICEGVAYAHKRGLVHCDLKPQNVMVTTEGRAKVTDFGIARAFTSIVNPQERAEVVWGTPQYYAPEQAAGEMPSPASDVYSIGIMLYEMLAGRLPFNASDTPTLARMHQTQEPPSLSAINPNVSLQLEGIVKRALAKDPRARYRSADQFAQTLASYLQQGEEQTLTNMPPVKPPSPSTAPSIEQRIEARRATPQQTQQPQPTQQTQFTEGSQAMRQHGTDILLLLLGAIATVCVLGLIPLYVSVYTEYTKPPASNAPTPVLQPQNNNANAVASNSQTTNVETQPPATTQTISPTATPTVTIEIPLNLVNAVFDDVISNTFASKGVSVTVTETFSLLPEKTILAITPTAGSKIEVSQTITFALSTGGRVDLGAQLPNIVIESAKFNREDFVPGATVQFNVIWRATGAVRKDYNVFVHLFDPSGNFIGQTGDRAPQNNGATVPTSSWRSGTIVVDNYALQIPLNALPGVHEIRIGLYDNSGRVPVLDAGRTTIKGVSSAVVKTIRVQ